MGNSPWGHKESDMTERLTLSLFTPHLCPACFLHPHARPWFPDQLLLIPQSSILTSAPPKTLNP